MLTFLLLFAALALVAVACPRMSDATARAIRKITPRGGTHSYPITDGLTIYEGMLAQLESGYINHYDGSGVTKPFVGIVIGGKDRARDGVLLGETSDLPPPEAIIDESGGTLQHVAVGGTPSQADVGCLIYCADSDIANLTKTDTTKPPVGRLVRFRSVTDCDVELFTPAEWLAGVADGTWLA